MNCALQRTYRLFAFLLLMLAYYVPGLEAQPAPRLTTGLSYQDVITMKGFPLSTDTHETSRITVWNYKTGPVYFKDGKTMVRPKNWDRGHTKVAPVKTAFPKPRTKTALTQRDVDDIISAIPSDKGGVSAKQPPVEVAPDTEAGSSSN
jgi:hypothetical protein